MPVVQTKVQAITSSSNSHQVQFPTPVTLGNWVVIIWRQFTSGRTPGVPSPAAGTWSGVQDFLATPGGTSGRIYCWSAQQTGAATDTYTITISGGLTSLGGIVAYELSGVDVGGTPRGGSGTQILSSTNSWNLIASPGISLSSGDIIIGAAGVDAASWGTLTAPSGFDTEHSSTVSPWSSTWVGDRTTAGSGITGAASNTTPRVIYTGYQVYKQAPSGGAYSITADPASVAISGQSVSLNAARAIQATEASIAVSGQSSDLLFARTIQVGMAAFSIPGQSVDLLFSRAIQASPAAITITGESSSLLLSRVLAADPGALALSGQPADLLLARRIVATEATVILTGESVDLIYGASGANILTVSPGTVTISGQSANLLISRVIQADPGQISDTGESVNLLFNRVLAAGETSVSVAGQTAGLFLSRVLQADPGQVSISGQPADLLAFRVLVASPAVIAIQGETVTLTAAQLAPEASFILWTSVDFRIPILSSEAFSVPRLKSEAFFG